jgi:hypothetical protein
MTATRPTAEMRMLCTPGRGVRRLWIKASSAEQQRLAIRSRLVMMVVLVEEGEEGGMENETGEDAEARTVGEEEEEGAWGLMTRRWIRDDAEEEESGGRTKQADVVLIMMMQATRRRRRRGWRQLGGRVVGGGARAAFISLLPPDRFHLRTSLHAACLSVCCLCWLLGGPTHRARPRQARQVVAFSLL